MLDAARRARPAAFALVLAVAVACTPAGTPSAPGSVTPSPTAPTALVTGIIDGDTVRVRIGGTEHTVRYIGIDAPETAGSPTGAEPFGEEASLKNRDLVLGKTVHLEQDVSNTDRYGRLLRYVWVDGTLVNAELAREGLVRVYDYPPDLARQQEMEQAQQEARTNCRGLWRMEAPECATGEFEERDVRIINIHYDGATVSESDEYAEIANNGLAAVELSGWRLKTGDNGPTFIFANVSLAPGARLRVYTDEVHSETGGLSLRSKNPVWNNQGDCGRLYDSDGRLVDEYCY